MVKPAGVHRARSCRAPVPTCSALDAGPVLMPPSCCSLSLLPQQEACHVVPAHGNKEEVGGRRNGNLPPISCNKGTHCQGNAVACTVSASNTPGPHFVANAATLFKSVLLFDLSPPPPIHYAVRCQPTTTTNGSLGPQ